MSDTYDDGYRAGVEAARRALVDHHRIALRWAVARVQAMDARPQRWQRDFSRGWDAGYRSVLTGYIHSQR
jgi:hypothetical protein